MLILAASRWPGVTMTGRRDTGPSARTEAAKWPRRAVPPAQVADTGVNSAKTQAKPESQTREEKKSTPRQSPTPFGGPRELRELDIGSERTFSFVVLCGLGSL